MRHLDRGDSLHDKELDRLLSAYLDDALEAGEKSELENYLGRHPDARSRLDMLRRHALLLHSHVSPPESPRFSDEVVKKIAARESEKDALLPFQRKYFPLAIGTALALVVLTGVLFFRERTAMRDFLTEKKAQVQQVYDQALVKADLLPLFSSVTTDQVLQFALFGTVPIDAEAKTALKVDRGTGAGYRIELARGAAVVRSPITVAEFYREIGTTDNQHLAVDSILRRAALRLQASVFIGDSNLIAVHDELPRLNETMMSDIAANLNDAQRLRFQRLLIRTHAQYTFAVAPNRTANREPSAAVAADAGVPPSGGNRFLVITPDTLSLSVLQFNADSLLQKSLNLAVSVKVAADRAHELMAELARYSAVSRNTGAPFSVVASPRDLRIEIGPALAPAFSSSSFRILRRESPDARAMEKALSFPPDMVFPPQGSAFVPRHGRSIDLDSLLDRLRQFDRSGPSVKKEKIVVEPIEL